jgi:hypothetical protein
VVAGVLLLLFEPTTTAVVVILIAAGVLGLIGAYWFSEPVVEEEPMKDRDAPSSKPK